MEFIYNNKIYAPYSEKENDNFILKAKSKDGDIVNINKMMEDLKDE